VIRVAPLASRHVRRTAEQQPWRPWRPDPVVAEPADLDPRQACGYWQEVLAAGRAVRARFDPVKLNYLTLGNTVPHLHTHVVPRYRDDPAPGGPIEWAQIFSPDPVPDTELQRQAAGLRVLLAN
jgi:diadenosine tetraphosphate (Ap4A) HIT family hydrolase